MKALLTTPNTPTSLFVARRLNELGYKVTIIDSFERSFISYSNSVAKRIVAPSLLHDPHGYAEVVLAELRQNKYEFYFPIFECGFLMAHYKETIEQYTNFISMPAEVISYAHNKGAMQEYAAKANVPIPHTVAPNSLEDAFDILKKLNSPVVIKPRIACNSHGQKIVLEPKLACGEYEQIVRKYALKDNLPLIQQYIKGPLICTVNFALEGEVQGNVIFQALRTVPTSGGTSSYRETINSLQAELFDARLIKHFKWTGFISFDYMQDESTGKLYLIDCNPRIAPAVSLAFNAGVDLIGAYVDLINGKLNKPLPKQKSPVRSKLQFLDLGWFLYNLIDKELSSKEKFQCFIEWIKPEKSHNDIESLSDMRPAFVLYLFIIRNFPKLLSPEGGELFLEHSLFDSEKFEKELKRNLTIIS